MARAAPPQRLVEDRRVVVLGVVERKLVAGLAVGGHRFGVHRPRPAARGDLGEDARRCSAARLAVVRDTERRSARRREVVRERRMRDAVVVRRETTRRRQVVHVRRLLGDAGSWWADQLVVAVVLEHEYDHVREVVRRRRSRSADRVRGGLVAGRRHAEGKRRRGHRLGGHRGVSGVECAEPDDPHPPTQAKSMQSATTRKGLRARVRRTGASGLMVAAAIAQA